MSDNYRPPSPTPRAGEQTKRNLVKLAQKLAREPVLVCGRPGASTESLTITVLEEMKNARVLSVFTGD